MPKMPTDDAIIWRESVWRSNFHCIACGRKLLDKQSMMLKRVKAEERDGMVFFYCKCGFPVAYHKKIRFKFKPGLAGNWDDWRDVLT